MEAIYLLTCLAKSRILSKGKHKEEKDSDGENLKILASQAPLFLVLAKHIIGKQSDAQSRSRLKKTL